MPKKIFKDPHGTKSDIINRKIKKLEREAVVNVLSEFPIDKEGREGDIYLINKGEHSHLLYKSNNAWHKIAGDRVHASGVIGGSLGGLSSTSPDSLGRNGYDHDSGWIGINDGNDSSIIGTTNNPKGVYRLNHRMGANLFKSEVFCRFEATYNGEIKTYTINLNSSNSSPGPNASRCGYWIESVDSNNADLHISPDGLSILYSERFKDTSDNTSVLLSSNDTDNIASMEVRVFLYPIVNKKGKKPSLNYSRVGKNPLASKRKNKKVIGKSVVGNLGATVDGTKNSSFKIDSDDSSNAITLKNLSGMLNVRNADDSADASIRVSDIKDVNNNKSITIDAATDATHSLKVTNSTGETTEYITLGVEGDETNANIKLLSKGSGKVDLTTGSAAGDIRFSNVVGGSEAIQYIFDMSEPAFKQYDGAYIFQQDFESSNHHAQLWTFHATADMDIQISALDQLTLGSGDGLISLYKNVRATQASGTFSLGTKFGEFNFATSSTCKLLSTANYALHLEAQGTGDVDIIPGGKVFIDNNVSNTSAGTYTGLEIDYDKTGTSTSNNVLYGLVLDMDNTTATDGVNSMYGILNTPTLTHAADAGATVMYGMRQIVTGGTNGSTSAYGILNTVTGADQNIGIQQTVDNGGIDIKLFSSEAADYCAISTSTDGETTIETVDAGGTNADLILDIDGSLFIDVAGGGARISENTGTYTPDHATSIVTKAYVDAMKHTAVWGGQLARIGASGTWLGIPTGHSLAALQMGTGSSPDTSYTLTNTADDLVACIWASMHDITVTGCKVWVGQGGATNTGHSVSLMRYDIDADGDLSNGVEVGAGGSINSDDFSQARAHTMTLSGTAANLDVDFSDGQILIAFVEPTSAFNSYMGAKVILEYTEVET